ncbi:hypothetical protein LSH36_122g08045 [Paralvinella palmiformis]|uniref:Uncharacterized protein n=1 Tax=Paralvinella palmiformis TaxID=53620 RepID=A0AAD9JYY4_9ANNE|nr:hypothetical protein LSH36_122g08045 [Paralvinella palmiformis]
MCWYPFYTVRPALIISMCLSQSSKHISARRTNHYRLRYSPLGSLSQIGEKSVSGLLRAY